MHFYFQAANRFKAAEMPSSAAETASVPAAIAEEEEEGEEVGLWFPWLISQLMLE